MWSDNQREEQIDKIMKSYYSYIGHCHMDNIVKELDGKKDEINQIETSSNMDEWFEEFSQKQRRKKKTKKLIKNARKVGNKVAIVLAVTLIIGTAITCTSEAFKIKILNFFTEKHEEYTSIEVNEVEENTIPSHWENYYYPKYLPKGFEIEKTEKLGDKKIIHFINDEKFILMTQSQNGTNYQIDTEKSKSKEIMINGKKGLLIEKVERTKIVWHNEAYSFNFSSNIKKEELIKVVKSLQKK